MVKEAVRLLALVGICAGILTASPKEARAAESYCAGVETTTSYVVKVDAPTTDVHILASADGAVFTRLSQGETYQVLEEENGWAKIKTDAGIGYIRLAGNATMVETTREKVDASAVKRNEIVNYAMQFVGGRYVYGGNDPHTGVDCSGFTRYVMQPAAGISLNRSSAGQATQGKQISLEQIRPGDLIFYASGSGRINHVALYIGDEKIVHASTEKTGIKVSYWQHRKPVKVISVVEG